MFLSQWYNKKMATVLLKIKNFLESERNYLIIVFGFAIVLRFIFITGRSIWHDEGFTMAMVQFDPWEIIQRTMRDVHPPIYYLSLHYWIKLFGTSELASRGFSAILGVGLLPFFYGIVKRLFDIKVARIAVFFGSFGPFLIRYSQEARMWMLLAFLVTGATYFFIMALDKKKNRWWILYSIFLSLAAYTQYFGLFILPVHWFFVFLKSYNPPFAFRLKPIFSPAWWLSNIFILGLFSFWFQVILNQTHRVSASYWIQKSWMTIRTVPGTLYRFLSYFSFDRVNNFFVPDYIHEIILILVIAGAIFMLVRHIGRRREVLFILAYFLLPMYIIFFYSRFFTPIYQDRYFVYVAPAFYVFLALAVCLLKNRILSKVIFYAITGFLIFGVVKVYMTEKHGMREVGREVVQYYQAGDEIIAGEIYVYFDFSYYNRTGKTVNILANPQWIAQGFGESSLIYDKVNLIVRENLKDFMPQNGRLWLVGKPYGDYYKNIPSSWKELRRFQKEDSSVILYSMQ